jgi:hypothetical protein
MLSEQAFELDLGVETLAFGGTLFELASFVYLVRCQHDDLLCFSMAPRHTVPVGETKTGIGSNARLAASRSDFKGLSILLLLAKSMGTQEHLMRRPGFIYPARAVWGGCTPKERYERSTPKGAQSLFAVA